MQSRIPGVFSTVDFGPTESANNSFGHQRMFEPDAPMVNSEFYTGWLDHWGFPHSQTHSSVLVKSLTTMLDFGASVNHYMAYGGTSFGFGAGANLDGASYLACPTSYDYDAPISEAGDLTQKYFDLKALSYSIVALYQKYEMSDIFAKRAQ